MQSEDNHVLEGNDEALLQLCKGENWLQLSVNTGGLDLLADTQDAGGTPGPNASILSLEAIGTVKWPTEDTYICIDVDAGQRAVTVKDMRTPDDDEEQEFVLCLQRRTEALQDDDDTDDDDEDYDETPEELPRRQMRLLQPGDRLCTLSKSEEGKDELGLVLTYKRYRGGGGGKYNYNNTQVSQLTMGSARPFILVKDTQEAQEDSQLTVTEKSDSVHPKSIETALRPGTQEEEEDDDDDVSSFDDDDGEQTQHYPMLGTQSPQKEPAASNPMTSIEEEDDATHEEEKKEELANTHDAGDTVASVQEARSPPKKEEERREEEEVTDTVADDQIMKEQEAIGGKEKETVDEKKEEEKQEDPVEERQEDSNDRGDTDPTVVEAHLKTKKHAETTVDSLKTNPSKTVSPAITSDADDSQVPGKNDEKPDVEPSPNKPSPADGETGPSQADPSQETLGASEHVVEKTVAESVLPGAKLPGANNDDNIVIAIDSDDETALDENEADDLNLDEETQPLPDSCTGGEGALVDKVPLDDAKRPASPPKTTKNVEIAADEKSDSTALTEVDEKEKDTETLNKADKEATDDDEAIDDPTPAGPPKTTEDVEVAVAAKSDSTALTEIDEKEKSKDTETSNKADRETTDDDEAIDDPEHAGVSPFSPLSHQSRGRAQIQQAGIMERTDSMPDVDGEADDTRQGQATEASRNEEEKDRPTNRQLECPSAEKTESLSHEAAEDTKSPSAGTTKVSGVNNHQVETPPSRKSSRKRNAPESASPPEAGLRTRGTPEGTTQQSQVSKRSATSTGSRKRQTVEAKQTESIPHKVNEDTKSPSADKVKGKKSDLKEETPPSRKSTRKRKAAESASPPEPKPRKRKTPSRSGKDEGASQPQESQVSMRSTTSIGSRKRQRKEALEVRVLITGLKVTPRHRSKIAALGGIVLESTEEAGTATHVIASNGKESLRRTPKLMIALCKTSEIVTMKWLDDSAKKRKLLSTREYLLLNDKAAEKKYDFCMGETLQKGDALRQEGKTLLNGRHVYVCKGVAGKKAPPEEELKLIIGAAGGKWVSPVRLKSLDPKTALIITSDPPTKGQLDNKDVARAVKNGVKHASTSWLFGCIMSQELSDL